MTIILGIETSCDETSIAILKDGNQILSNIVSTQINVHKRFGGVVPEIASRMHTEKIHFLLESAFKEANLNYSDLSSIAVTYGPGLEGSLLIGLSLAKTLAYLLKVPLIGVNHLMGHIYANFLNHHVPKFPFIVLIVSGGHTQLVLVKDYLEFVILGSTKDDAAGEAFDKVAKYLGLPYPGGPIIEKMAKEGNPRAFPFPIGLKNEGLDFSFSGLKTAVIQKINNLKKQAINFSINDVAASFQKAVIDALLLKSLRALKQYKITNFALSGGVAANKTLRDFFINELMNNGVQVFMPETKFATDNAAMIAAAGFVLFDNKKFANFSLKVKPNLSLC